MGRIHSDKDLLGMTDPLEGRRHFPGEDGPLLRRVRRSVLGK